MTDHHTSDVSRFAVPPSRRRGAAVVAAVLAGCPPLLFGGLIFSDSFDGSGGVPDGWAQGSFSDMRAGTGITEGSGTVSITDLRADPEGGNGPTGMTTTSSFDPFPAGATSATFTVDIAGMSSTGASTPETIFVLGGNYGLFFRLNEADDQLFIRGLDPTFTTMDAPSSPYAFPYAGEAVSFVTTLDADSFRVTSSLNSLDTGDITYASIGFAGFDDITDMSPSSITLIAEADGGNGTTTVNFDRVSYSADVAAAVPEASAPAIFALGAAGILLHRRRRRA
ncbi:MAG: hypothetical protein HKN82_04175 [Akkermansiaceae bacterium]|nr:hypothetical protein [Akkermansiaceae bacterium]NNM27920.1 hypothetical protein [Akkermansiaceae bacterium]